MSIRNGKDYLYLIWKCPTNRRQYIVGQLIKNGKYEFQYCEEIEEAKKEGFTLLVSFEDLDRTYECDELFPVFSSRLPDKKRKDIQKILEKYGLEEYNSYELLKRSGARLPIDNLHFIDPILDIKGAFRKTFFVAGARHYLGCEGRECDKAIPIEEGDEIFLIHENNLHDKNAVRLVNKQQHTVGYIPRYYSEAFVKFIDENRIGRCFVEKIDKENSCDECIKATFEILNSQSNQSL
ncbi:MAG: HIRAN domain-containing protein [Eubacteriales bacterium]|nr:HIRAN domain-containing protein [Eubacteriales bacterium]